MGFSTLSGGGQGADPNAFDTVVKTDTTYQVPDNPQKRVIAQNTTVTMPSSHTKGDVVLIERVGDSSVDVRPNGTELIETNSVGYIDQDNTVAFVSGGTNWYAVDGSNFLYIKPDSVARYTSDGNTNTGSTTDGGFAFQTASDYSRVGFELDPNISDHSRAILREEENTSTNTQLDNQVVTKDISGVLAGGSFTIDHSYDSDIEYTISVDNEGSNYARTYKSTTQSDYPFTSADVDITAGYFPNSDPDFDYIYNVVAVGDPDDL